MFCTKCGQELDDEAKFCTKCGINIQTQNGLKFCINCGKQLPDSSNFCIFCGFKMVSDDKILQTSQNSNIYHQSLQPVVTTANNKPVIIVPLLVMPIIGFFLFILSFYSLQKASLFRHVINNASVTFGYICALAVIALIYGIKYSIKPLKVMGIIGVFLSVDSYISLFIPILSSSLDGDLYETVEIFYKTIFPIVLSFGTILSIISIIKSRQSSNKIFNLNSGKKKIISIIISFIINIFIVISVIFIILIILN
jgi:hypothetical protein